MKLPFTHLQTTLQPVAGSLKQSVITVSAAYMERCFYELQLAGPILSDDVYSKNIATGF